MVLYDRKYMLAFMGMLLFSLPACQSSQRQDAGVVKKNAADAVRHLYGSYAGSFGDVEIMVTISAINGDKVEGHSVVMGTYRPFAGTLTEDEKEYKVVAREPGDHPHDGIFHFAMNKQQPDILTGNWQAFDPKIGGQSFSLTRKAFGRRTDDR